MPIADPGSPSPPSREAPPSPDELIVTAAFRRRATAIAERCLPTIIREAEYEELEELIAIFRWFDSAEARQIQAPEEFVRVPGMTLEEAAALVRFRRKRRTRCALVGGAAHETTPPAPAS